MVSPRFTFTPLCALLIVFIGASFASANTTFIPGDKLGAYIGAGYARTDDANAVALVYAGQMRDRLDISGSVSLVDGDKFDAYTDVEVGLDLYALRAESPSQPFGIVFRGGLGWVGGDLDLKTYFFGGGAYFHVYPSPTFTLQPFVAVVHSKVWDGPDVPLGTTTTLGVGLFFLTTDRGGIAIELGGSTNPESEGEQVGITIGWTGWRKKTAPGPRIRCGARL